MPAARRVLSLGSLPTQWIGALDAAIILAAITISRVTGGKARDRDAGDSAQGP